METSKHKVAVVQSAENHGCNQVNNNKHAIAEQPMPQQGLRFKADKFCLGHNEL